MIRGHDSLFYATRQPRPQVLPQRAISTHDKYFPVLKRHSFAWLGAKNSCAQFVAGQRGARASSTWSKVIPNLISWRKGNRSRSISVMETVARRERDATTQNQRDRAVLCGGAAENPPDCLLCYCRERGSHHLLNLA